jgi:hypothetical protein
MKKAPNDVILSRAKDLLYLCAGKYSRCFAEFTLSEMRTSFAEFTLSGMPRSFASLRMTSEGLRVTISEGLSMTDSLFHQPVNLARVATASHAAKRREREGKRRATCNES